MVGIINRGFLAAAAARWACSSAAASMLLRGSYVTGLWIGEDLRRCEDLDFVAVSHSDLSRAQDDLCTALSVDLCDGYRFRTEERSSTNIFADTPFPGLRILVPCLAGKVEEIVQFDIGFNDPIPLEAEHHPLGVGELNAMTVAKELGYAWKLHGLIEREGLSWRPKDLADLWLMQQHTQLHAGKLATAVKTAMESRDAPAWRLDRLLNKKMGRSTGSLRRWRRYVADHPESGLPESLCDVVDEVATFAHPIVSPIFERRIEDSPPTREAMRAACAEHPAFRCYQWDGGEEVFVCERTGSNTFPALDHAETNSKHLLWLNRREARGITFGVDGELLARPYAQFEVLKRLQNSQFQKAEVLEKLDGSLVFPTRSGNDFVLRTRRRRSEISESAKLFAEANSGDYEALIKHCLSNGQTTLFEWCSRSRLIVFDHPQDRLVLTGIRDHMSGKLLPYENMARLAAKHGVECARRYKPTSDLENWTKEVEAWTNREGCIIRIADGSQFKIKSDRYRWLHRAVEGAHRDRARWQLILCGATEQLYQCSKGRDIDLKDYAPKVVESIANYVKTATTFVSSFHPETRDNRKRLAAALHRKPNLFQRMAFAAFENEDATKMLAEIILERCDDNRAFNAITEILNGPRWND